MAEQAQEEKKPARKLPLTQCDEIWDAAKERWGDPGRRHPKPDPKFEKLRPLLAQIDTLFDQKNTNEDRDPLGFSTSLDLDEEEDGTRKFAVKKKHFNGGRKIASHDHLDDEDEGLD